MEISLRKNHGFELTFKAENVNVCEDIEERQYPKDSTGKTIINLNPKRDIKTDVLQQFLRLLEDMIYYREAEFDSSELIKQLFEKLPTTKAQEVAKYLHSNYSE